MNPSALSKEDSSSRKNDSRAITSCLTLISMSESHPVTVHKDSTKLPPVSLRDLPKRAHPRWILQWLWTSKTFPRRRGGNSEQCHLYGSLQRCLESFSFQIWNNPGNFRVFKKRIANLLWPPALSPLISVFLIQTWVWGSYFQKVPRGQLDINTVGSGATEWLIQNVFSFSNLLILLGLVSVHILY